MERAHVKLLFKYQDFYQGKHGMNVSKTGMERLEREKRYQLRMYFVALKASNLSSSKTFILKHGKNLTFVMS